ncbi:hypothetical protein F5X68DRAFT_259015 [Plectosphaerella plurivora]|uniref:Uncharacterized protein n=1 Tax=Plectosphaerella plurivora TaxID=936078 RepID=A0A9P8VJE5_9PEZI|nr:hypothetical protein F5X68DRAFT_259015 [Plectosphaerella plurivora]
MALIRVFAVRLAATRPCVAATASGSFATWASLNSLPPSIRRAFTQSSHVRYAFAIKKSTDGDKTPGTETVIQFEKMPEAKQGTEKTTPGKQGKEKTKMKGKTPSKAQPVSETMVKITPEAPQATTPPNPPTSKPEPPAPTPPPIDETTSERLLPEVLLIYSPGQARIVYIAFWKVTSLLLGVTCTASIFSTYIAAGTIGLSSITVAACSFIPFALMNYIARPFVTYMFLRLPPHARTSREHLERFIQRRPPPDTRLRIMTLGLVVKPRVTDVTLEKLKPAPGRYGLVDYTRDVSAIKARRRWYEYLPVSEFGIADSSHATVMDAWAWNTIRPLLGKTLQQRNAPWKPLE